MAGNKRITVRLTEADRKFLHIAGGGGGRGAIQAGFDACILFAREQDNLIAALRGLTEVIRLLLESDDHVLGGDLWKFINDEFGAEYEDACAALASFDEAKK